MCACSILCGKNEAASLAMQKRNFPLSRLGPVSAVDTDHRGAAHFIKYVYCVHACGYLFYTEQCAIIGMPIDMACANVMSYLPPLIQLCFCYIFVTVVCVNYVSLRGMR